MTGDWNLSTMIAKEVDFTIYVIAISNDKIIQINRFNELANNDDNAPKHYSTIFIYNAIPLCGKLFEKYLDIEETS